LREKSLSNCIYRGFCSLQPLNTEITNKAHSEIAEITDKSNTNIALKVNPDEDFLTFTSPTFNFAAYVNKSETLGKFVELGVDLSRIEKKKGLAKFVLQLDFEKNIKPHLFFLHDLGIPAEDYGQFITKNPLIFKESIEDLETRVYYLRSKKFSVPDVRRIVTKNPFWLSFSTRRIDRRLGWFQKNFLMTGDELRTLTVKQPKVITYNLEHIREANFSIREQMGFEKDETKALILAMPKLLMQSE
jgi:mTERF domain-containing protein, mitochondrial